MKSKRFSLKQVAGILKEYDNGKSVAKIIREHGVSNASFYKWRERYGGMNSEELKKLKALEEETVS